MLVASETFYFDESGSATTHRRLKDAKIAQFRVTKIFGNPLAMYAGA